VAGVGSAKAQSQLVRSGAYGGRLSATSAAGSYAYARKTFGVATTQVTVAAALRVAGGGTSGNVPLLRLYDPSGARLVSFYRQNQDADRLYVQHSGRYNATSGRLALNTWARFELTVSTAGNQSSVAVKMNGTTIYQSTSAALGTAGVKTLQLGNDISAQPFDLAADDVVATTSAAGTAAAPPPPPSGGCDPEAPDPTNSDPGTVVVADNFEGGLGAWSVTQNGDARVTTQSQVVRSGGCAARIAVTRNSGSLGNMTRAFPAATSEVWSDGWFNFEAQGVSSSWNTPTFRFFSDGRRILDVSRQNQSASMFVRYPNGSGGWTIKSTGQYPSLKRWYHVRIHAIAEGAKSTVEVWLDGTRIFSTTSATLGTSHFSVQMIGADHATQEGTVAVDDVVVKGQA
jgi:hypothetical protein